MASTLMALVMESLGLLLYRCCPVGGLVSGFGGFRKVALDGGDEILQESHE